MLDRGSDSLEPNLLAIMSEQGVHASRGKLRQQQAMHPGGKGGRDRYGVVLQNAQSVQSLLQVVRLRHCLSGDKIVRQGDDGKEQDNQQQEGNDLRAPLGEEEGKESSTFSAAWGMFPAPRGPVPDQREAK